MLLACAPSDKRPAFLLIRTCDGAGRVSSLPLESQDSRGGARISRPYCDGVKRRKSIWIAGAALAVLALGAFASLYRPAPYEFLRGAAIERGSSARLGQEPAKTRRAYTTAASLGEVVASAKKELTPEKGWKWNTPAEMDPPICENVAAETWIAFYHSDDVPLDGPRRIVVVVVRPTHFGDGFFTWIARL